MAQLLTVKQVAVQLGVWRRGDCQLFRVSYFCG